MRSVHSTVTSVLGVSGQTLSQALSSAVGLNDTVWDSLIGAAGANRTLRLVVYRA
jgi:hypothetical protein